MAQTLADEYPVMDKTFKAEAVMSTRYIAVKQGTSDDQVNIAGDGEAAIGILQDTAAAIGDAVRVRMLGISLVKANTTIAKDAYINSAASTGKVAVSAAGERAVGIAMRAATAQDDEIPAFITPFYYAAT